MTVAEFNAELEGWCWRQDRRMDELAWLAWHFLSPHMKKGSRIQPRDLLPEPPEAKAKARSLSPSERARTLDELKREMGIEE